MVKTVDYEWPEVKVIAGVETGDSSTLAGLRAQLQALLNRLSEDWPESLTKRVQLVVDGEYARIQGWASLEQAKETTAQLLHFICSTDVALEEPDYIDESE